MCDAGFGVRDILYVIGPIRTAQEARKSTEPMVHLRCALATVRRRQMTGIDGGRIRSRVETKVGISLSANCSLPPLDARSRMIAFGLQKVSDPAWLCPLMTTLAKQSYSQWSFDLQDNEFAWLEDENASRHQCKRNDKHDGCGNDEAAE